MFEALLWMLEDGSRTAICASPHRPPVTRDQLIGDAERCAFAVAAATAAGRPAGDRRPTVWVSARDPYLMLVATLGSLRDQSVALIEAEGPWAGFDRLAAACPPALVACDVASADMMCWARAHGRPVLAIDLGQMPAAGGASGRRVRSPVSADPHDDVLLSFFTSGTTGIPKCVGVGAPQLVSAILGVAGRLSLTSADTSLSIAPLTHTLGMITTALVALASGGSVAFADPRQPQEFLALLGQSRPTWCAASPSQHKLVYRLLSRAGTGWPELRFLRSSAAPMSSDFAGQLENYYKAPVVNAYAMTEAPGEIASQAPDNDRVHGTVGRPTLCEVEIRSDSDPISDGKAGEIWIRGPNVVVPGGKQSWAWIPTGDIGSFDSAGFLRITGRADDIINSGGLKIWPPDVEAAARTHPAVSVAVAFPIPHQGMGESVGLAVVPASGHTVDTPALRRRLMAELPRHAWPSAIVVCADIPLSARGKIARRALWSQLPGSQLPGSQLPGAAAESPARS